MKGMKNTTEIMDSRYKFSATLVDKYVEHCRMAGNSRKETENKVAKFVDTVIENTSIGFRLVEHMEKQIKEAYKYDNQEFLGELRSAAGDNVSMFMDELENNGSMEVFDGDFRMRLKTIEA